MKTKRKKILEMQKSFDQLSKGQYNFKFSYFIAKNNQLVKDEVEIWKQLILPSGKFKEYEDKRIEIVKSSATKQENGMFKMDNGEYVIADDKQPAFYTKIDKLKKKYKKVLEERKTQMEDFDNSLETLDVDIEFSKINIEDMPNEITPQQVEAFIDLIID